MPKVQQLPSHLHSHPIAMLLVDRATNKIVDFNKAARAVFQTGKRKVAALHLSDLTAKPKVKLTGKYKSVGIVPFETKSGKVDFTVFAYAMDKNATYACYELHPVHPNQTVTIERTLKAFLDNSKEVLFLLTPDFKIIAFNRPAELSIQAIHRKQVKIGDSMLDYSEPSTHDLFKKHFSQALAGKDVNLEIEVPYENYARWWNVTYRQIIDSNKQLVGVAFSAMDIHEQKLAEQEALGLATKLKATLNASNDYTYLLNAQHQIVLYNEGAKLSIEQFYKREVTIGDSILDYSPAENKPLFLDRLGRAFSGETISAEICFTTPVGVPLWFDARYAPVKNSSDQVIYVSFSLNNITARKQSERLLRKKELQLATLADNIPKAVVFQYLEDKDGKFIGFPYMSSGSKELFGMEAEQIQSNPLSAFEIVHPDDLPMMLELNRESRTTGSLYNYTHRIIVDGKMKWILTRSKPTRLEGGSIQWDGFSYDITDRKRNEQSLIEGEERFRKLYNESPAMMHSVDKDGFFLGVSDYWLKKMEYTREEVIGKKSFDFLTPQSKKYAQEIVFPEFFETGILGNIEYQFVTKSGKILDTLLSATCERDSHGRVVRSISVMHDITDFRKMEAAKQQQELLLQNLVLNLPDSALYQCEVDTQNNFSFTYLSESHTKILGTDVQAALKNAAVIRDMIHPDDLVRVTELEQKSKEELCVFDHEFRQQTTWGEYIWIHARSAPRLLPNGSVKWDGVISDVTERRKAEHDLELKKFTINHSSESITWIRPDGSFTDVNLGAVELLGYSFDELTKMTVPLIDVNYNDEVWSQHWQELREKKSLTLETVQRKKDGTLVDVEVNANYIYFEGEEFNCAYVRDITERKRSERRLIESENKYRLLANNMQDMVCLHSLDGLYKYISPSSKNLLGYEPEELLGKDPYSFFHPDDIKRIREDSHQVVLEGNPVNEITYQFKHKAGHYVWLETQSIPVYGENSQTIAIQTSSRNVTLRKEASSQLARSQKLYESIINSQSNFLIRTDMLGYYSFASQRFLDHFGFEEHEIIGKHSFETIHPEDHASCEKAVMECIQTPGKISSVTFRKPNKQGDFYWTEWEFIAIQNEEQVITEIQGIGYDITDKLTYQKGLEEAATRLRVATQSAGIGIWELDVANDLLIWDDQMYRIFGVVREGKLRYESFYNCIYPEDRTKMDLVLEQGLKERNTVRFRTRIVRGNDKAVRHIQGFGIFKNEEPTVIVGVNYDITDVIENEIAVEKAKSKIEELELKSLRAAMNPHFIFNALASVQYFITQNNREGATQFLSKFAKLVRGILNSSVTNDSTVASELELIKYYVEIELIRFENKFDFEVIVEPLVDIETITIPALLIQPYVENAIIHGLYPKEGQGKLKVSLRVKNDFLEIVIEDNGIGRQAGAALRERNFPRHQSHGMGITSSRIDLIRNYRAIGLMVEDLEQEGLPIGTRITLQIKI